MSAILDARHDLLAARETLAAFRPQPFVPFSWQPARSETGGPKAVWVGAGKKEPLYGADAEAAIAAQDRQSQSRPSAPPGSLPAARAKAVEAVRARVRGHKSVAGQLVRQAAAAAPPHVSEKIDDAKEAAQMVGAGAKLAGRGAVATARFGRRLDRATGRAAAAAGEGVYRAGRYAADTKVGRAVVGALGKFDRYALGSFGRKAADRLDAKLLSLRHALRSESGGLTRGAALFVGKTLLPYFGPHYRANRRKYGRPAAVAIELATAALDMTFKRAAPVVGGLVGYHLGGPVGAAAGAFVGGRVVQIVNFLAKQLFGQAAGGLGRTLVSQDSRILRTLRGDSVARQRKKAKGQALLDEGVSVSVPLLKKMAAKHRQEGKPIPPELQRRLDEASKSLRYGSHSESEAGGLLVERDLVAAVRASLARAVGAKAADLSDDDVLSALRSAADGAVTLLASATPA